MKRTIRLLAAPAAALLLLSACGSSADETEKEAPARASAAPADEGAGQEDESSASEDDGAGTEEDVEGDAIDDGGESDVAEFDGERLTLDVDALINGTMPASGTYFLEGLTGVKVLAEVGATGPDELEAYRESVGADPVTYIRFDVDNREGSEEIGMYNFAMYDEDGAEYLFSPITDNTNEWTKDLDSLDEEQWDRSEALDDADLGENAAVGQRNEQWLVGPADLPDEVTVASAIAETFADEFVPFPVK